jgi:hypothetical protein
MNEAMPAYYTREYIRQVQMALNEKQKANLPLTGVFGKGWSELLKGFQINHGLVPSGRYDDATRDEIEPLIHKKYLQQHDYEDAALVIGCTPEALQAICLTFAVGTGFISNGRARIVFNREKFYKELGKQRSEEQITELVRKHPTIVSASGGGYLSDDYEYVRFAAAISVDSYAAMMATNWGMFQLPGLNYRFCGYSKITEFTLDMQHSERRQLRIFADFIKNTPHLLTAIKATNWEHFCQAYCGPAFQQYDYHTRIARHYRELTRKKRSTIPA